VNQSGKYSRPEGPAILAEQGQPMTKKLWVIRPEPNFVNRLANFLEKDIVAIGWPEVGDLSGGQDRPGLAARLCQVYGHYLDSMKDDLAMAAGVLDRFVNQMKCGDFVLIPQKSDVFVGEVTGDYSFHPELGYDGPEAGYPHWRQVRFLKDKKPFSNIRCLPLGVRRAIDCHLSVFSIHAAAQAMWTLINKA
jgi:predicted Mrr-cat superfamily restriction endonuclease